MASEGRRTSSTSAVTVRSAAPPVRSTPPFRLFSSWPATSTATFGRASKFAPTTPIGIRRSETSSPFGSVQLATSRSSGGSSASSRSCASIAVRRPGSRRSRSSAPSSSPRRRDEVVRVRGEHARVLRGEAFRGEGERSRDGLVRQQRHRRPRRRRLPARPTRGSSSCDEPRLVLARPQADESSRSTTSDSSRPARQIGAPIDPHRGRAKSGSARRSAMQASSPSCIAGEPRLGRMDPNALEVLEFPAIRERVARAAATELGEALASSLEPSAEPAEVQRRQALTAEAIALLDESLEPPLERIHDVREQAAHAALGGALAPQALRRVSDTVAGAVRARARSTSRPRTAPARARPRRSTRRSHRSRRRSTARSRRTAPICATTPRRSCASSAASCAPAGNGYGTSWSSSSARASCASTCRRSSSRSAAAGPCSR